MLETCDITNKDELLAREQHYIDTLRPTLNMKNVVEPSYEHGYLNDRNCPTCRTKVYCPHGTLKAGCVKQKKICCIHVSENFCPCNKQKTVGILNKHNDTNAHRRTYDALFNKVFDPIDNESL